MFVDSINNNSYLVARRITDILTTQGNDHKCTIANLSGILQPVGQGSQKRQIWSDTDTDIFKTHFYIYTTVIFHT